MDHSTDEDCGYIRVARYENDPDDCIISFPVADEHEIISLMTIQGQFSDAIGLKYKNGRRWIAIHQDDAGGLYPPPRGWISVPLYITVLETEISNVREPSGITAFYLRQRGADRDEYKLELNPSCGIVALGLGGLAFCYTSLENQKLILNMLLDFLRNYPGSIIRSINHGSLLVELQFNSPKNFLQFVSDYEAGNVETRFSEEYSKIGTEKVIVVLKNKEEISKQKKEISKQRKEISKQRKEIGNKTITPPRSTKVRNRAVTSKCSTTSGKGWLKYYKTKYSGLVASNCRTYACTNKADVGAHVELPRGKGSYIIPSCQPCNVPSNKKFRKVKSGTCAVLVTKKDTKGPKLCYSS